MSRTVQICIVILFLTIVLYSASKNKYEILSNKCVGCADCIDVCPKDAITIIRGKAVIDSEKCIGCGQCLYICSFYAIRVYERGDKIARFTVAESQKEEKVYRKAEKIEKSATQAPANYSIADELNALVELRDAGIITEEEVFTMKKKLLSQ